MMIWQQAVIVYAVCWWLIFMMALPFGAQPAENPESGQSRAAPRKTYLGLKCFATTLLAAFATWGIDLLLHSGIVALR